MNSETHFVFTQAMILKVDLFVFFSSHPGTEIQYLNELESITHFNDPDKTTIFRLENKTLFIRYV